MPLDELLPDLKSSRFNVSSCVTIKDMNRMLVNYQNTVEESFQELVTQIINIINNGGGGATSPVYIIRALVNQLGGVPASQVDFPFDDETLIFSASGNAPVFDEEANPRIARNPGRYLQDNEVVELTSFNGSLWLADKISENTIAAKVVGNVTTGDLTFDFYEAVALGTAPAPAGGEGIGVNLTENAYSNDEVLVLKLVENPEVLVAAGLAADAQAWAVVQDDDEEGGGTGGTDTNLKIAIKGIAQELDRTDETFQLSQVALVSGSVNPGNGVVITNKPPLKVLNTSDDKTVFARFDKALNTWTTSDAGNWDHIARGQDNYQFDQVQVMGHLSNVAPDKNEINWLDTIICNPEP